LVVEELKQQSRKYKPLPKYLQSLVGAAIYAERAWKDVGFAHTYSPQEPSRLPLDHWDRMRKEALNKAVKARRNNRPRHNYRVLPDLDDDCDPTTWS
jgi:hypothetical protein